MELHKNIRNKSLLDMYQLNYIFEFRLKYSKEKFVVRFFSQKLKMHIPQAQEIGGIPLQSSVKIKIQDPTAKTQQMLAG